MQIVLHPKATIQIANDYLAKIRHEIQFLRQYCPFSDENDFASLVLTYLMSENRLAPQPFLKAHCRTAHTHKAYEYESDFQPKSEKTNFGWVDTLFVDHNYGVYRLRIAPHSSIPTHIHRRTYEKECALTGGLLLQGKPLKVGETRIWPLNFPHRYDNHTLQEQSVLCIDAPAFDPDDEILVDTDIDQLEDLKEKNKPLLLFPNLTLSIL